MKQLFEIEDFEKDDLIIRVNITGKNPEDIQVKKYERWLKETGRLALYDHSGKVWASFTEDAYWDRSEFLIAEDLYVYLLTRSGSDDPFDIQAPLRTILSDFE